MENGNMATVQERMIAAAREMMSLGFSPAIYNLSLQHTQESLPENMRVVVVCYLPKIDGINKEIRLENTGKAVHDTISQGGKMIYVAPGIAISGSQTTIQVLKNHSVPDYGYYMIDESHLNKLIQQYNALQQMDAEMAL